MRGFHLLDALTAVQAEGAEPLMTRFGGHAYAVGFSLPSGDVGELRERMQRYAAARPLAEVGEDEMECDIEVRLGEITPAFLDAMERLGPFGNGNAEPVIVTRGVRLAQAVKAVKERHLRLSMEDAEDGTRFGGMAWARRVNWAERAAAEGWSQGDALDIAYKLRRNWHPEFGGWELEVLGMRSAKVAVGP